MDIVTIYGRDLFQRFINELKNGSFSGAFKIQQSFVVFYVKNQQQSFKDVLCK